MISFVSVGRWETVLEVEVVVLVVAGAAGGWLMGRLETVVATRGRSWAAAGSTKPKMDRAMQADSIRFLFKFFTTYFSR